MKKTTTKIKKAKKYPKGFYCLLDRVTGTYQTEGYPSFAKALYEVQRYWSVQPLTQGVSIMIESKLLYYMDTVTRKETFMSEFSDFRTNYASESGHSMDSLPSLKKEERTVFIRGGIPFTLGEDTAIVKGTYGTQIAYSVKVDQSSPEFKSVGKMMNIGAEYIFWVKAADGRLSQYNQIIRPLIDSKPDTMYCLIKPEGSKEAFDFERYVPGVKHEGVGFERVFDGYDAFDKDDN